MNLHEGISMRKKPAVFLRTLKGPAILLFAAAFTVPRLSQAQILPPTALPLPIIRQSTDYSCGAAAALSLLYYWQVADTNETALYSLAGTTPEDGTEPGGIVNVCRHYGLEAEFFVQYTLGHLAADLATGATVVVGYQAWVDDASRRANVDWPTRWDDGHYSVVVAMDDDSIYLMDPSAGPRYTYIPLAEFQSRWHDVVRDSDGNWVPYQGLAIVVRGTNPLTAFPAGLIRTE